MKINVLQSQFYLSKKQLECLELNVDYLDEVVIDSGGYTIYNAQKGDYSNINKYIAMYEKNVEKVLNSKLKGVNKLRFVQLDIPRNNKETRKLWKDIYKPMKREGLNMCPIWTLTESPSYLIELLEENDFVFIGGLGSSRAIERLHYRLIFDVFENVADELKKHPKKCHLLGVSGDVIKICEDYVYSFDVCRTKKLQFNGEYAKVLNFLQSTNIEKIIQDKGLISICACQKVGKADIALNDVDSVLAFHALSSTSWQVYATMYLNCEEFREKYDEENPHVPILIDFLAYNFEKIINFEDVLYKLKNLDLDVTQRSLL